MKNISVPNTNEVPKEELIERLNEKKRVRYMYWVFDKTHKDFGYYVIVESPDEVPKGKPFHECIWIG